MSVVKVENGVVVQVWRDVADTDALRAKYGLSGAEYMNSDALGGYLYAGGSFSPPPPPAVTKEQQRVNRQAAYANEADPLFFKAQRGEATAAEWLAKVAEIKGRYPYPTE